MIASSAREHTLCIVEHRALNVLSMILVMLIDAAVAALVLNER